MDGDHPVFLAKSLNDRHNSRLDHEEVAALVSRCEQNVAWLDRANAAELSQSRELVLAEARKCSVTIGGLRETRSDWLRLAAHGFIFSRLARGEA